VFVTIGESERPQISSMHTNRPLFNLPGEGVSLYQSPVIVKFIIPKIAMTHITPPVWLIRAFLRHLPNPARAASTYSYSPDRSRGPIPTLALPHLRAGMPRSGFSPAALEFTAGPHQAGGGPKVRNPSPSSTESCANRVGATGAPNAGSPHRLQPSRRRRDGCRGI
jgi:hypothetical protein